MRPARRPPGRSHTRDRWMVSYADMVTLLLACFAALYASSVAPPAVAAPSVPAATAAPLLDALQAAVHRVDDHGDVVVQATARGVVVSLPEAGAFALGEADLSQTARRVIREIADVLAANEGEIRVEGHTDDLPITTPRFTSNWELSAARATEVIRFLIAQSAITPERLSAAGYGEFRPVVPNTSATARARNRRVDIVVVR